MLTNILLPVKKKEKVGRVPDMARLLKSLNTQKIILLNAGKNNGKDRIKKMEQMKEALENESFTTELVFRQGHVATQIVRAGLEKKTNCICLPWKRKNPIRRAIMGSVVPDTIRLSSLPILVYKTAKGFPVKKELNTILYATSLMNTDIKILKYLTDRGLKVRNLILLHVGQRAPDPVAEEARIKKVHANMTGIEEKCADYFEQIEKAEVVPAGSESTQIARKAFRKGADLIIIGKVDKQRPFGKMTGSVTESLPEKANCSVMIVPGVYPEMQEMLDEEKER